MKAFLARALVFALPCVAMAQIANLQIKVLEGEGAVHPPGVRISRPLVVEVSDENGRPVADAAVSFQLPPEGAGGLFSNGLRTDLVITDANGRAAVHAVQLNRLGGPFRIRITAVKEQARAGTVSLQYIGENKGAVTAAVPAKSPATVTRTQTAEITPTTTKMSSGSHKKWIVLAVLVAGGGAAFAGVSHRSGTSAVPASVVTIGTPTITVGHP